MQPSEENVAANSHHSAADNNQSSGNGASTSKAARKPARKPRKKQGSGTGEHYAHLRETYSKRKSLVSTSPCRMERLLP